MQTVLLRSLFALLPLVAASRIHAQATPGAPVPVPPGQAAHWSGPRLLVVDETPAACAYGRPQDAVDAAGEGDVLLVRPFGAARPLRIHGKSLRIVGEDGARCSLIEVTGLAADQAVTIRGLDGVSSGGVSRITLRDNAGPVILEDCGAAILVVENCAVVGLSRCSLRFVDWPFVTDSSGARVQDSTLFAYDTTFLGRSGNGAVWDDLACQLVSAPQTGGFGIELVSGEAFLFGSSVRGGTGGSGIAPPCVSPFCVGGGDGGDGLFLASGTGAVALGTILTPGSGGFAPPGFCARGPDGAALSGTGSYTPLTGATGSCQVVSPVVNGSPVTLQISGPPGFGAFLTYSQELAPVYVPERKGYSIVDPGSPVLSLGPIPGTGVLTVQLSLPPLARFQQAGVYHLQAKLHDPVSDSPTLAAPTALFVVRNTCP